MATFAFILAALCFIASTTVDSRKYPYAGMKLFLAFVFLLIIGSQIV